MSLKIKCNECVHKEVCAVKDKVNAIEEILNVESMTNSEVEIELGCKHYNNAVQPYISPNVTYSKWCSIYNCICDRSLYSSCLNCPHGTKDFKITYATSSAADIPGAINRTEGIDSDRSKR